MALSRKPALGLGKLERGLTAGGGCAPT